MRCDTSVSRKNLNMLDATTCQESWQAGVIVALNFIPDPGPTRQQKHSSSIIVSIRCFLKRWWTIEYRPQSLRFNTYLHIIDNKILLPQNDIIYKNIFFLFIGETQFCNRCLSIATHPHVDTQFSYNETLYDRCECDCALTGAGATELIT